MISPGRAERDWGFRAVDGRQIEHSCPRHPLTRDRSVNSFSCVVSLACLRGGRYRSIPHGGGRGIRRSQGHAPVDSTRHVTPCLKASRAVCDPSRADPQLLHHRPHRPRQVHAGRPHAADHRRGQRPRHARAVPRPYGHRARARHHDQEPGRAHAVADRRRHVRPQHDRHARSRRLHLRGVALARRVRGRDPARRRGPGHRGADPREPLSRPRERSADHPGAQQDRPSRRRPREVRGRAREPHRRQARRRASGERQDRHGGRRAARPHRREDPRPDGRCDGPGAGDDLRLGVRRVPRRRHVRPHDRRQARAARAHSDDVDPRDARTHRDRRVQPRAGAHEGARRR